MRHERLVERRAEAAGIAGPGGALGEGAGRRGRQRRAHLQQRRLCRRGHRPAAHTLGQDPDTLGAKAMGGLDASSLALLTTNPAVRTLADLSEADRIALPAVKVSQQAVLLQMAAEALWGRGQHERLDGLTVSLPHSEAVPALLGGAGGITAHFSNEPFQTKELRDPRCAGSSRSDEILGGPATVSALYTTSRFRDANPDLHRLVLGALAEAQALIADDRARALAWRSPREPGLGSEAELRLLGSPGDPLQPRPAQHPPHGRLHVPRRPAEDEAELVARLLLPGHHDAAGS